MNYLFDVSPEDLPDEKRASGKKRTKRAVAEHCDEEPDFGGTFSTRELRIIGKIDGVFECADSRCGAMSHDIIDDFRGQWRIECAFCGTGQRVEAIPGALEAARDEFRFNDGLFEGLTVAEAAEMEKGVEYVSFCAKKHKRKEVREACSAWLDLRGASA